MSPLDSTAILLQGVGAVLRPSARIAQDRPVPDRTRAFPGQAAPAAPTASQAPAPPRALGAGGLLIPTPAAVTHQATIRQAQILLQITAGAAPSPALRQIAAAAYQMEIDARRELARLGAAALQPAREWFA